MSALADLPLIASGKVREIYEGRIETLLIVASDRISTYDVVHPTPIPDKGAVLTGLSTFWFERTAGIVPNHLRVGHRRRARTRSAAARMVVRKLEMLPVECVVRGYITGSGWKDYQRTGDGLGHRAARGPARVRPAPRADLHPVDQGRRRPRRGDRLRARGRAGRRPRAGRAPARCLDRGLRARRRARARARDHPRRHEVRVRARRRRRADARRRGVHAGLLALLARRRVRARPRPAELRQAVRPRLGLLDGLGPQPAGARRSPRTSSRARARSTSRPTSGSPASRSTPGSSTTGDRR